MTPPPRPWPRVVIVGLSYLVLGLVFGELAGRAGSHSGTVAWRWAAWIVSGLIFVAQMVRNLSDGYTVPRTAMFAAIGAAIGAFGLAVAAMVHAIWWPAPNQNFNLYWLALVIWPIGILAPAYLVGLVASAILKRFIMMRAGDR